MAWLQNLAGKAEDLLNKIDKNAANVLNDNLPKNESNDPECYIQAIPTVKSTSKFIEVEVSDHNDHNMSIQAVEKVERDESDDGVNVLNPPEINNAEMQLSTSSSLLSRENSFHIIDEFQINMEEKILKLESDNRELNKQILNLQHLYSELQNENINVKSQLERANESVSIAQNEMEQYKNRAQRILQEKEKLLSHKSSSNENSSSENESDKFLNKYNNQLKDELVFQQTKNNELTKKIDDLNASLNDLQRNYVDLQKSHHLSIQSIKESLNNEKKMRGFVEEECRIKTKELQSSLNELNETKNLLNLTGNELKETRNRLKEFTGVGKVGDFESRLHSLTQTLMVKQNTLETITSERNALRIQLEKLENEFQKVIAQKERVQIVVSDVNETDDVKSQVPKFMIPSPFDAGVTRRVKHAYSTLDAVSVRTGVFLRRYPLARVFVFSYMVLLHLWMMIILCTYMPSNK
ncbi:golgin-84 [Onthophagus taurus]|uniref:golgin-84 n=1 Tax=Onthophagus taurus TaxID=166361 RepID=UPI000C204BE3|nr:golgin-84 [Onthophagus taurus]